MKKYLFQFLKITRSASYLFAILLVAYSSPTYALSADQRRVINSGADMFNVEDTQVCRSEPVDLQGNDNLEKIFNFFLSKGLTKEQAAGITGNAYAESGGNPEAESPNARYRGIFQWDTGTGGGGGRWGNLLKYTEEKSLDPMTLEGQLEFAFYEASNSRKDGDGDFIIPGIKEYTDVPHTTWYWGRYFEGAVVNGSSSDTPLTNVQHLDKRTKFAQSAMVKYGGGVPDGAVGTVSAAACIVGEGENTQYIDNFTIYSQYDPSWKDKPYSTSTIGVSGCGPTAMATIITNLLKKKVTPVETANYAASIGMYQEGVGSSWSVSPKLASKWGLKSESIDSSVHAVTKALREGKVVITPGQGGAPFTSGGHFIVIRGITAEGKYKVADSNNRDNNDLDWDPDLIVGNMRDGGAYAIYQ